MIDLPKVNSIVVALYFSLHASKVNSRMLGLDAW